MQNLLTEANDQKIIIIIPNKLEGNHKTWEGKEVVLWCEPSFLSRGNRDQEQWSSLPWPHENWEWCAIYCIVSTCLELSCPTVSEQNHNPLWSYYFCQLHQQLPRLTRRMEKANRRDNLGARAERGSLPVLSRVSTRPPRRMVVHQHNFREPDSRFIGKHDLCPAVTSLRVGQNDQLSRLLLIHVTVTTYKPRKDWTLRENKIVCTFTSHPEAHTRLSVWQIMPIPPSLLIKTEPYVYQGGYVPRLKSSMSTLSQSRSSCYSPHS